MRVEIYSKDNCPYCDMAIRKAEQMEDTTLKVLKLNVDFDRDKLMDWFPGARTFPQIKVDGRSIGGWDQFKGI